MKNDIAWQGKWIWVPGEPAGNQHEHEIVYFRKRFQLTDPEECRFLAGISADSSYRLYINGKSVCTGPSKGNRYTHYYETIDLSEYLVAGTNVIGVQTIHYRLCEPYMPGIAGPASVWRAKTGAFIFDGVVKSLLGNEIINLCSDENWKCKRDAAIKFHPGELERLYVGGWERVDGSLIPWGWQLPQYDDSCWEQAVMIADVLDSYGQLSPWVLEPRLIPLLYEKHKGFAGIKQSFNTNEVPQFYSYLKKPLQKGYEISAGSHLMLELDAGELLTAYPFIEVSGGRGAFIKILYSECYYAAPDSTGRRIKAVRDDAANGVLIGERDIYKVAGVNTANGGIIERYEPVSFRTFRFICLEIETAEEPLTILRFNFRETGYPLEITAEFQSSELTLTPLWDISVNTLKWCMHETYEDCPYYEQFQYIMDTYLQAAFTYRLSGDDRLARKAILDFHSSALPDGLLQSRYPSIVPQVIPGFSLYWILMVYDHYVYYADVSLVRRYLPTIDGVLGWFDSQINSDGLIDRMPEVYWSFVDWVDEWRDNRGVPVANQYGLITVYSLLYITALQAAAELNAECGRFSTAEEYRKRADLVKQAVKKQCWSEKEKLFQDGPGRELYSQHPQIWAVLSETIHGAEAEQLMDKMLENSQLPKVSYSMSFFLFRALSKTGRYEKAFKLFEVWKELVNLKLTTWVEDPVTQRSDCHGWGAVPIYEFMTEILGIKPERYGFRKISISPRLGELTWAKGSMVTPLGIVRVEWKVIDDMFYISCSAPEGTELTFELPDGETVKWQGGEHFEAQVTICRKKGV